MLCSPTIIKNAVKHELIQKLNFSLTSMGYTSVNTAAVLNVKVTKNKDLINHHYYSSCTYHLTNNKPTSHKGQQPPGFSLQ